MWFHLDYRFDSNVTWVRWYKQTWVLSILLTDDKTLDHFIGSAKVHNESKLQSSPLNNFYIHNLLNDSSRDASFFITCKSWKQSAHMYIHFMVVQNDRYLGNGHFEIFLSDMDSSFAQCKHTRLRAYSLYEVISFTEHMSTGCAFNVGAADPREKYFNKTPGRITSTRNVSLTTDTRDTHNNDDLKCGQTDLAFSAWWSLQLCSDFLQVDAAHQIHFTRVDL